jgi:hypothetical protein
VIGFGVVIAASLRYDGIANLSCLFVHLCVLVGCSNLFCRHNVHNLQFSSSRFKKSLEE